MSDQPRWPRGTPVAPSGRGPGGGRFRDSGGGLATAVATGWAQRVDARLPGSRRRRLGLSRAALQALFDNPPASVDEPLSGGSIAQTHRRTFEDGRRIVVKYALPWEADAEYLTSLVGEAVGAPVPAVIPGEQPGQIWMSHAEGPPGFDTGSVLEYKTGGNGDLWEQEWGGTEPTWRLALLDLLAMNGDRHSGNWMSDPPDDTLTLDPQSVVGIDHNRSWVNAGRVSPPRSTDPPPLWLIDREYARVALLDSEDYDRFLTGMLSVDEIEQIEQRLHELEPEFDRLGRQDWWQYTIGAWEQYKFAQLGTHPDPEEGARVASAQRFGQQFSPDQPVSIRFTSEDVENWDRMSAAPYPGWHRVVAVRQDVQGDWAFRLELRSGSVIWIPYSAHDPITYRSAQ